MVRGVGLGDVVVFVGGDIFRGEFVGLELSLPHQHVEPEFDIVISVERVLRQAVSRPNSRRRWIVAPLPDDLHFPRHQTSLDQPGWSGSRQQGTHTPQQAAILFDHLIGTCDDLRWHRDTECLGSLEVYAQFDFHGLLDR